MQKLSLIIPTNSHRRMLLRRTLKHLSESNFLGEIIIADHSPCEHGACEIVMSEFQGELSLRYRQQSPNLHFLERIVDAANILSSEFVMMHADDDFALVHGLEACVTHLLDNSQSVLCQGRMAHIKLQFEAVNPEIIPSRYSRRARIEENPLIRLIMLLQNYCASLYAVHRRECLLEALAHTLRYSRDLTYWQYLLTSISVLQGQNAVVEELQYLREKHDNSWSATAFRERNPETTPWIFLSPKFPALTQSFRAGVSDFIRWKFGEPKEHFWPHFDEACMGLFRWALGCGTTEKREEGEDAFFEKLCDPNSQEHAAMLKCGKLMVRAK